MKTLDNLTEEQVKELFSEENRKHITLVRNLTDGVYLYMYKPNLTFCGTIRAYEASNGEYKYEALDLFEVK